MSPTVSRHPGARRRGALAAAGAAVLGLLAPVAALADEPTQEFEVDGRVVYRTSDRLAPASDHFEEGSVTTAYAEVGDAMIDLSAVQAPTVGAELAPTEGLPAGGAVSVTIEAPAGLDEAGAIEAVSTVEGAASTATQVVAVEVTDAGANPTSLPTAGLVDGVHQLVVVPVRWSSTAAVPAGDLQTAAAGTEAYWQRQSSNRIDIQTSVRPAVTVTRPTLCDVDLIMDQVVLQTGLAPTSNRHVAVWFPEHADCGFAGLASINGGAIWLNGATQTYVLAHELGHNFGLGHANTLECTAAGGARVPLTSDGARCEVTEYGDDTDVMGQGRDWNRPGSLSSGFAHALGWADVTTISGPVLAERTVDLAPLSQTTGNRGVQLSSDLGPVYTDYRPAVDNDAAHRPEWAGVQARLVLTDPHYWYSTSYLLDLQPAQAPFANPSLPVGQSWEVPGADAIITTTSTGGAARITVSPSSEAVKIQRYVTKVYQHLFQRAPDAGGLTSWSRSLLSGTPRSAVAAAITSSDEYRNRMIAGAYLTYLGRNPDRAGAAGWLRAMKAGSTVQEIESGFLASPEYYNQAGRTGSGWVTRLYQHVLGRSPAAAEVQYWTRELAAGASRQHVAMGFLNSTEHLTTVVDGYYVDLLGRHIDPVGRQSWVTAIQRGARLEAVIGGIIASPEYYSKV
ncbi:DUF4214 domain-containing protein [Cellulomonas pakistanensis]|uniref:DUF4214 domain-containing protein n=1 Tax=Cellulomonas pakistanensis TaxID=992287 RepID=A0A919U489_9CELL|nr:DUF4214 domain-containing protein [Cellulomonas pakistanensis]GIG34854.1 hypothetical protein Cpa01nite_02350 [Cellulomonas pakistanensis]